MKQYEHGGNIYEASQKLGIDIKDIIDFSANINPYGPSPMGLKTMETAYEYLTAYPDPRYCQLTEKVADYLQTTSHMLYMNNGAIEGLHEVIRYIKPTKAILIAPCFVEYEKALSAQHSEIIYHELLESESFNVNVDRLLTDLNREKPQLLILCTPNNPTGRIVPREGIKRIVQVLKDIECALILDEAFIDFLGKGYSTIENDWLFHSIQYDKVFISRSFTKFFGVPGLRLGALKTYDETFDQWRRLNGVPWNINVFAEHYAYGALIDVAYQKDTIDYVQHERRRMLMELEQIQGIKCFETNADYLLIKVFKFEKELVGHLNQSGILIRSCQNYKGLNHHYFRVAVKKQQENNQLVYLLKEFFKSCVVR